MRQKTANINDVFNVVMPERTESNTVRRFTSFFRPESIDTRVSINIDWLSIMAECNLPEPDHDAAGLQLSDNCILEHQGHGTPVFKHSYKVYLGGEPVANIHTHSKSEKIIKKGTAKIELLNNILYGVGYLDQLREVMEQTMCTRINNVSEMHIALDGANHIHKFLNLYVKQNPTKKDGSRWDESCKVRLKGKANVDPKRLNRSTGLFDNFKIGSIKKYITVYNKTAELEHSRKEYIREVWKKAEINMESTVWRTELRLKSGAIKEIKDFDLSRIEDANYLLQIFKTQTENFFQFVLMDKDKNVSRARIIDLFQFEKLRIPLLEKIPRAIVQGAYKAQLSIHNAYSHILKGYYKTEESIGAAMVHIQDNINLYNLQRWYNKKIDDWRQIYRPSQLQLAN